MRKNIKFFGREVISWGEDKSLIKKPQGNKRTVDLPAGRVSIPSQGTKIFENEKLEVIRPKFLMEVIPSLRQLVYSNPNISQAVNNIVELGNNGHIIKFDSSVNEDNINKMRAHIKARQKEWSESCGGMNGLVNKMISQIMISGALSNEWVPNIQINGIKSVVLVNPELIRWIYDRTNQKYKPFQYVEGLAIEKPKVNENLLELNPNTYKYYSLNGDTDNPYGIPPYIPVFENVETQKLMMNNIRFIIEQVGLMGFLQVLIDKPDQNGGESIDQYRDRLSEFLKEAKKKVQEGYRDGVTVGYKEDTEFEFHATTKNMDGVDRIYQLNELQFISGLKQDPSMLGRNYSSSESQITVIFTKLLAQLKNIQALIICNLEFGYSLELRLAGFKFNTLSVEFNPTTAIDKLKEAQAEEINIRNQNALFLDGIISQDQYAHNVGYEKPDQSKPRFVRGQVQTEEEIRQKREASKDKSDKKVRDKNKPQGSKK